MTHQGSCSVINHRLHQRLTLIRLTVQPFKTWRTETTVNTNMILKNKLRQRSAFSERAALPLYWIVLNLLDCNTGCFAYTLIQCCCFLSIWKVGRLFFSITLDIVIIKFIELSIDQDRTRARQTTSRHYQSHKQGTRSQWINTKGWWVN